MNLSNITHVKIAVLLFRLSLHVRLNVQAKIGPVMVPANKSDVSRGPDPHPANTVVPRISMATAPPVPRVHDIMVFLGLVLPAAHPYHRAVLHLVHQLVFLIPRVLVQKN